jgi:hypothetical protein
MCQEVVRDGVRFSPGIEQPGEMKHLHKNHKEGYMNDSKEIPGPEGNQQAGTTKYEKEYGNQNFQDQSLHPDVRKIRVNIPLPAIPVSARFQVINPRRINRQRIYRTDDFIL